jgi:hypothetical protein
MDRFKIGDFTRLLLTSTVGIEGTDDLVVFVTCRSQADAARALQLRL